MIYMCLHSLASPKRENQKQERERSFSGHKETCGSNSSWLLTWQPPPASPDQQTPKTHTHTHTKKRMRSTINHTPTTHPLFPHNVSDLSLQSLQLSLSLARQRQKTLKKGEKLNKERRKERQESNREMSEAKDPAIKLFGKTIPLPEIPAGSGASGDIVDDDDGIDHNRASPTNSSRESNTKRDDEQQETEKDTLGDNPDESMEDEAPTQSTEEVTNNPDAASRTGEESDTPPAEKDATTLKASKSEEEQSETSNLQEKTLKKPDKILPCPRCNSMDTKFCYYNNYNVNQPRHFCKNCQRYWTAGGTMRNVPVGAGRRKNKNSSHYRQITVAEALQTARADMPNGVHHPTLKPNGTVLAFGSDTPLCESMASVLNLADKTMQDCTRNGFHRPEELRIPVPYASGEKGDDHSNKSPVMSTKPMDDSSINRQQEQAMQNCQSFPAQVPYYPGAPWPFPWNPVQWSSPVPPPTFCPPGFTMPFYPAAAYWGCTVSGAWNIPWLPQPTSPNSASPNSGPNSPTLGKHSREENMLKINDSGGDEERGKENGKEKCLWVPKTLRIDDPGEAAKSSIWTTLGIKNDKAESVQEGGLFRAFPSKGDRKDHSTQSSTVLQANPAALSSENSDGGVYMFLRKLQMPGNMCSPALSGRVISGHEPAEELRTSEIGFLPEFALRRRNLLVVFAELIPLS